MSNRKHFHRSERYERGESASCNAAFLAPIIAAGISAGAGYLSSRQQARNARSAMANQAAYAQPRMWGKGAEHARTSLNAAGRLYGQGMFAPPTNPQERWAKTQLMAVQPYHQSLAGLMRWRWKQALSPTKSPYVDAMVKQTQRGLLDQYNQNILPRIASQAQGTGGFGGSRQGVAQGLAAQGLSRASAEIENKIRQQGYGQALQQQRAAWKHAPTMFHSLYQPAMASMQAGAMTRAEQERPIRNLAGYGGMISPYTQIMPGAQSYPPQYPQDNPWTGALQGGAFGLGLYSKYRDLQKQQFTGDAYGGLGNPMALGAGTL